MTQARLWCSIEGNFLMTWLVISHLMMCSLVQRPSSVEPDSVVELVAFYLISHTYAENYPEGHGIQYQTLLLGS